jgi:hypothetical protein
MDSTFFGPNTGIYFYSTIFQGDMALVGLIGLFVVFKLQRLIDLQHSCEDRILSRLDSLVETGAITHRHELFGTPIPMHKRVLEHIRNESKPGAPDYEDADSILDNAELNHLHAVIEGTFKVKDAIERAVMPAIRWSGIVIVLSLVLMPLANETHRLSPTTLSLEALSFVIMIVLNIWALKKVWDLVRACL